MGILHRIFKWSKNRSATAAAATPTSFCRSTYRNVHHSFFSLSFELVNFLNSIHTACQRNKHLLPHILPPSVLIRNTLELVDVALPPLSDDSSKDSSLKTGNFGGSSNNKNNSGSSTMSGETIGGDNSRRIEERDVVMEAVVENETNARDDPSSNSVKLSRVSEYFDNDDDDCNMNSSITRINNTSEGGAENSDDNSSNNVNKKHRNNRDCNSESNGGDEQQIHRLFSLLSLSPSKLRVHSSISSMSSMSKSSFSSFLLSPTPRLPSVCLKTNGFSLEVARLFKKQFCGFYYYYLNRNNCDEESNNERKLIASYDGKVLNNNHHHFGSTYSQKCAFCHLPS